MTLHKFEPKKVYYYPTKYVLMMTKKRLEEIKNSILKLLFT